MKKPYLLILIICFNHIVLAQQVLSNKGSVSGIVSGFESKQVIVGASVTLITAEKDIVVDAISTNNKGEFLFENISLDAYYIKINNIGFENYTSQKIIVDYTNPALILPSIKLLSTSIKLKEVVVEGAKRAFIEQRIDKTVINIHNLISNTGINAVEVLNNTPGVEVNEEGVSMRNKSGVTIYIDGKQLQLQGKSLVNYLKSLPSSTLTQLELIPNPPAKYHSDGNSGIINILTKKTSIYGFGGNVSFTQGQGRYPKSDLSLNLHYKTKKTNIYAVNSNYSDINYFSLQRNRNVFNHNSLNYTALQNNFETNNEKANNFRFGIDYVFNKKNSIQFVSDGAVTFYKEKGLYDLQFQNVVVDSIIKTSSDYKKRTINYSTGLNYRYKDTISELNISANFLKYLDNNNQELLSNTYTRYENFLSDYSLFSTNKFDTKAYSVQADYDAVLFNKIRLSSGLQSIISKRYSNAIFTDENNMPNDLLDNTNFYNEHTNALYLSLNKKVDRISIQTGLRYEHTSATTNQLNHHLGIPLSRRFNYNSLLPSLYVAYNLDTLKLNTLNFSINTAIERPKYESLNPSSFYFDKYNLSNGNPLLQASR